MALALVSLQRLVGDDGDTPLQERLLHRTAVRAKELGIDGLLPTVEVALASQALTAARHVKQRFKAGTGARRMNLPLEVNAHIHAAARAARAGGASITATAYLTRATAWEVFGAAPLAALFAQLQVEFYSRAATVSSAIDAVPTPFAADLDVSFGGNASAVSTQKGKATGGSRGGSGYGRTAEDDTLGYCKLAVHKAKGGDYAGALTTLMAASTDAPAAENLWLVVATQIAHEWALARGDTAAIEAYTAQLQALAALPSVSTAHAVADHDARFRRARLARAKGDYEAAAAELTRLAAGGAGWRRGGGQAKGSLRSVAVLLELAEVHLAAGSPLTALDPLLVCLTLCERYSLDTLFAGATVALAEVGWVVLTCRSCGRIGLPTCRHRKWLP